MMRWLPVLIVASLLWAFSADSDSSAQEHRAQEHRAQNQEPPRTARQDFMRKKLESMNHILEGVLLGRHQQVADHAEKVTLLTHEEAWQVIQTQEYFERSNEFRRTSTKLAEQARKKKWDAEALTYLSLTQQCIQCHRAVRGEEDGGAP